MAKKKVAQEPCMFCGAVHTSVECPEPEKSDNK